MPITFSVEPCEGKRVIYQRVAPTVKDGPSVGMLYFYVDIVNPDGAVTLKRIDVSFPGSSEPGKSFARDQKVGAARREWLVDSEVFTLTKAPSKIRISLVFAELAQPVSRDLDLGPHKVSYQFFARPEDIDVYGEYIRLNGGHLGESGGQQLAQDAGALGWRDGKLVDSRSDGDQNADRFLFGRPFFAMGDGLVLLADDSNEDNPKPGKRVLKRMPGGWEGDEKVSDLGVACLRTTVDKVVHNRIVLAAVDPHGILKLTVLEQTERAESVVFRGEVSGSRAQKVQIVALSGTLAITATQNGSDVRFTLWEVKGDASVVERDHFEVAGVTTSRMLPLSGSLLLVATRASDGTLTMTPWEVVNKKFAAANGARSIGPVGAFDLVEFEPNRFATAVLADNGKLKCIAWRIEADGGVGGGGSGGSTPTSNTYRLDREGDAEAGAVTEIAAVDLADANQFGTAVRQADGTVKFIVWDARDGEVKRLKDFSDGAAATMVRATFFKREAITVLNRTAAGKLRVSVLEVELYPDRVEVYQGCDPNESHGTTDLYAVARQNSEQPTIVSVVRTTAGTPKVILWQYSYNNFIKVLYGDEIVTCVHLQENSIPAWIKAQLADGKQVPVTKTSMLGRMGHSGTSSGPHLHIQADRVLPHLLADLPDLVERIVADEVVSVIRPMQFHGARAMINSDVKQGGAAANPNLGELEGHGVYFKSYVVLPGDP